ncbi:Zinc finger protein 845 [Papilio machaon]|uniref:Zinc finger protein 845 n=1 Tax=Papilio machaon TaxID=76193 RepID=A0A194RH08_PAPMA|nr:Zinc finger protein 845 [Papilio machaon]
MEPSGVDFNLHWEEVVIKNSPKHENDTMCNLDSVQSYSAMTSEEIIADTDQMAAENLMYLSQDVVGYAEPVLPDELNVECVTEEVITDDWVLAGGQERVEVPMEQLVHNVSDVKVENDIDVPLPTDQDQYTAMRPWPCDFCSRRFRKKAALMNHMVAHQNDRPHACNLCGVRYVRKCDLMNHLKVHAFVPDNHDTMDYDDVINNSPLLKPKKKRGRRKKNPEPEEIHGGDSPVECGDCGELYWSREALAAHAAHKHPHAAPRARRDPSYELSNSDDDYDYRMSSMESSGERTGYEARGPELRCQDCGVAFQRVDLLRRHVAAAHNYKRHDSTSSAGGGGGGGGGAWGWGEHACDVCGETFADPLQLLAHAEGHAERHRPNATRLKRMGRGKTSTASSNNSRQFPCKECGKVFGSRSSQQIHVRGRKSPRQPADDLRAIAVPASPPSPPSPGMAHASPASPDTMSPRSQHSPNSPAGPYKCEMCSLEFEDRDALLLHVPVHI